MQACRACTSGCVCGIGYGCHALVWRLLSLGAACVSHVATSRLGQPRDSQHHVCSPGWRSHTTLASWLASFEQPGWCNVQFPAGLLCGWTPLHLVGPAAGLHLEAAMADRSAARPASQRPPPPPPPPMPPPLPPHAGAVEVTRERIVAPPERFIAVSDDSLLQHFQGERASRCQRHVCSGSLLGARGGAPHLSTPPLQLLQARCPWMLASWRPCLQCWR